MSTTLTVELPDVVNAGLQAAASEEGVSDEKLAARAVEDYLFLRHFRKLRQKMERDITDQQVFDLVS
jgi:predicted transcriptional regulator